MAKRYITLFPSAAYTATATAVVQIPEPHIGVRVFIDVTADPASASVTPTLLAANPDTTVTKLLLTGAALTAVGDTVLEVFPGATAAANTVANDAIGRLFHFTMTHADGDSMTYEVVAEIF